MMRRFTSAGLGLVPAALRSRRLTHLADPLRGTFSPKSVGGQPQTPAGVAFGAPRFLIDGAGAVRILPVHFRLGVDLRVCPGIECASPCWTPPVARGSRQDTCLRES
jgi:hypothetical protein